MPSSRLSGYDDDDVFDPANPAFEEPPCRVCGCTELNSETFVSRTGAPGHWVDSDLCSDCDFNRKLGSLRELIGSQAGTNARVELPVCLLLELLARYDYSATPKLHGSKRLRPTMHALIKTDDQGCHWIDGRFRSVRRRIRCGTFEEALARLAELR